MDYAKLANALTYSNNLKKDILKNSIHLKKFTTLFAVQPQPVRVIPRNQLFILIKLNTLLLKRNIT